MTVTTRITFPNADIQSKTLNDGDTLTVTPNPMPTDGGHPVGRSVSFEFKMDDLNQRTLEILFGIKPKRWATKVERAVALAVVIENVLAAPARYGWALARREASLAASVPFILKGVVR
jgi:hypothetical protein